MFHLFQMNGESVLSGCCIYMHVASICFKCFKVFHTYVCECFILMLHIFATVSNVFQMFSQVFHTLVSSVSFVFFCMLQLLHLYVSKIDRVLHMDAVGNAGDVRGGAGPLLIVI